MSFHRLSWSLVTATLCLSGAGGAHAQIVASKAAQTNVGCFGTSTGSATVGVSGATGPVTYSWSNGATTSTVSSLAAGAYTATVFDGMTSDSTTFSIAQQPALTATASKTDVTTPGANDGTASVAVSGGTPGYTYSWSPAGGTAATASGLGAATYSVTVKDDYDCQTTATVTVGNPSVTPAAVPTLTEWAMIFLAGLLGLFGASRLGLLPAARKN